MNKLSFPADYAERSCYMVMINASLVPYVAGALRFFEKRGTWATDSDYEQGYNAFAELQVCMMKLCVDQLIESNDRVYRLLSGALYGTEYSVVSTDPDLVIEPPIPNFHSLDYENENSILGRMEDMRQLLQNALNGTETPLYDRANGVRDLLEAIQTAVESEADLDPELLAKLGEIAVLLA